MCEVSSTILCSACSSEMAVVCDGSVNVMCWVTLQHNFVYVWAVCLPCIMSNLYAMDDWLSSNLCLFYVRDCVNQSNFVRSVESMKVTDWPCEE